MTKKILSGQIVSNKSKNTLVIKVERKFRPPLLKKFVKRSKKYHAHYEDGDFKIGQIIKIQETRPISKLKRCRVI